MSLTSIAFGLLLWFPLTHWGHSWHRRGRAGGRGDAGHRSQAVYWAIGGWRDELFAFSLFRVHGRGRDSAGRRHSGDAVLAGALSGGACLTRSRRLHSSPRRFVAADDARREIRRELTIAIGVMSMLVAPFLINCAIATGDPLYAINNHTEFYLNREGAADCRCQLRNRGQTHQRRRLLSPEIRVPADRRH